MTGTQNRCEELEQVVAIARAAGDRILDVYQSDFHVDNKADGSPLTEADTAANRLIVDRLAALNPQRPLLSEEEKLTSYSERAGWDQYWLVDPLDGTREFTNRNGEFTVNIALIAGGRPILGVVHVPVSGVTYLACQGFGAFRQDADGQRHRIQVRNYGGGRATVVASRSHAGPELGGFLARLKAREGEYDTASLGSSLKICLVAEGNADVYPRLGPTSEWDTAAAQCVLEVAGGRLTTLDGEPLAYNHKESLLNPWFLASGGGSFDWISVTKGGG